MNDFSDLLTFNFANLIGGTAHGRDAIVGLIAIVAMTLIAILGLKSMRVSNRPRGR
ncbi:hypothetical protein EDE08_1263 [Bradyrhizobium sp. R2.2-H]|jgi:hypothetical protein|uniref:hypothetical protein n=1 Tax=unclassified Bradyrhizobium TaxID=2631580 RepID=UPI0010D9827B|nr:MULTISPECIES: hypothetical protein [unclassified Bradyrhizobium]TCU60310.1 hypothetical protein EDE10_12657 [Bradyrhizobium sp. Y-H1]TCU63894.1 hypothetical protein EDE08_1263 [Bradyrhizobium sp. R2.2-H]